MAGSTLEPRHPWMRRGYFFIAGRQRDMIEYKGYKVLPGDVEDSLYNHPAVLECAGIGIPAQEIGKTIAAFVVVGGRALRESEVPKTQ